jgi:Tfp pilus assembly protein PilE
LICVIILLKYNKKGVYMRLFILKKGAMFGLDARIALAIFGALSVISGAALYSSIKKSETIRMTTEIAEVKKAVEQYMLDTGLYLTTPATTSSNITIGNLYKNYDSITAWNGPYIGVDSTLTTNIELTIANNKTIDRLWNAKRVKNSVWSGTTPSTTSSSSCNPVDCAVYLRKSLGSTSSGLPKLMSMYEVLDEYVDNSDGSGAGDIRAVLTSGGTFVLYLRLFSDFDKLHN